VTERKQFSSFFVNDLFFGIEVAKVREVAGALYMTPVPLAPPAVRGLVNLRGQIVTVIDLRCCLQVGERTPDQVPVNLILYTDDGCASLLVDEIGEVLEVDEDTFELPPETLQGRPRELILGAYKLDNRLMHVLDLERTLNFAR
jgi:purine-binding chemotaxis protein CheW